MVYSTIYYFCFEEYFDLIILIQKISFIIHLITLIIPVLINPGIPKREYYKKKLKKI